ncbi:MAG: maleate cis-trans isomerase [bacterium]|jgi:maleate cis-trans isomerase|nr:maleate cis-trans isomerase [Betaproteobacteria bacterium]
MGWEVKLGIIVPSWNTVMEYEWQRLGGEEISVHSQRIRHLADTEADLSWLGTQAPAAAELLSHARVQAICHGCTASGFLKTPDADLEQEAALTRATGIPTVTSSAAIVRAMRALGASRISVASPYEPWLNARLKTYLEAAGFTVVAMKGLGTQAHGSISTEVVRALALEVVRPETEAVFISCSNFRTLDILAQVEQETGRPVVTSNQAALWGTLRAIGDRRALPGGGRLFGEA